MQQIASVNFILWIPSLIKTVLSTNTTLLCSYLEYVPRSIPLIGLGIIVLECLLRHSYQGQGQLVHCDLFRYYSAMEPEGITRKAHVSKIVPKLVTAVELDQFSDLVLTLMTC